VLGLVDVGAVNTNVLKTDKVLAVGGVLWDLRSDVVLAIIAPGGRGEVATVANALLMDLEPVARSVVLLHTVGSEGHVDKLRAGVTKGGINSQGSADLIASVDGQNLGLGSRGKGTLVATDIGTINERAITDILSGVAGELGRVVCDRTSRLANILEGGLLNTIDDVRVDEVMGGGHLGDGGNEESRELHFDWQK